MSLPRRLWDSSPRALLQAARRGLRRVRTKPRWVSVASGPLVGQELYLNPSYETWLEMQQGKYDNFIYDALSRLGTLEGATFWDIGAHFGYHSLSFAALAGASGRVVSFEPNPSNIARFQLHLQRNAELSKRIELRCEALSNADGDVNFVMGTGVDNGRTSGSHLEGAVTPLSTESYNEFERTTVRVSRIDTLYKNQQIGAANVIKIDVEGAELTVLEGGVGFLSQFKPVIFMEVHNILMMFSTQQFLQRIGYELELLDAANATVSRCFVVAKPRQ